jgi:hypothetical protein
MHTLPECAAAPPPDPVVLPAVEVVNEARVKWILMELAGLSATADAAAQAVRRDLEHTLKGPAGEMTEMLGTMTDNPHAGETERELFRIVSETLHEVCGRVDSLVQRVRDMVQHEVAQAIHQAKGTFQEWATDNGIQLPDALADPLV